MEKATLLKNLTQQTEHHLQLAIHDWQMMPHSILARMPGEQQWSANQCLQHLNSYGRYYLPLLDKALRNAKAEISSAQYKAGWLGSWFTNMMKPDAGTGKPAKKMKAPSAHSPTAIVPSHEVVSEFIEQQEQLLQLLAKAEHLNIAHTRIPISIATFVKLKAGDVLSFLITHNERHVLQAQRALAAANKQLVPGN